MYCPRCGHQPISDAIRFCSYCGLKLGVVKASLADDDEVAATDSFTITVVKPPRQRDMNIGVILMFAGAMTATFLAGRGLGREGGALILAAVFSSLLFLSRPILKMIYKLLSWDEPPADSFSVNQRGMIFGSSLMFISTIVLVVGSLLMVGRMMTPEFFLGLVAAFVLLLIFSRYLMRAIRYLVAADAEVEGFPATDGHEPTSVIPPVPIPSLTPGGLPLSVVTSQRVTTAEILSPASVTEHTTNLLENK
jgi:hypothetical protein